MKIMKNIKKKNISITRALYWYCSNNNINDIIDIEEYNNIINI